MKKIKEIAPIAEISGETITKVKSYTISREMDSSAALFDKALKSLQKEFGFDIETEVFEVDDL